MISIRSQHPGSTLVRPQRYLVRADRLVDAGPGLSFSNQFNLHEALISWNIISASDTFLNHTWCILKVTVEKDRRIKNWTMVKPDKAAPVTATTLRTTGPVPADLRQYVCMYVWSSHIAEYGSYKANF